MKSPIQATLFPAIVFFSVSIVGGSLAWSQNSSLLQPSAPEILGTPPGVRAGGEESIRPVSPMAQPDTRLPSVMPPEMMQQGANRFPYPNAGSGYLSTQDSAIGLNGVSWTYQPAPPLRQFNLQDIVTIRVDEIARTMAEGEAQKRRNSIFLAVLADWIQLTRFGVIPDPQEDGDPTVAGQSQSNFRSEATVETREQFTFNIAARIVDIRPNGNLVLEARKKYRMNDNLWETSLSGICRAQDIGPDNVILSKDLIDLEIMKEDRGQLRDGYQRGWFQRVMDRIKPF